MKYTEFLSTIRKNKIYIFTLDEIMKYFPDSAVKTLQNQLQIWTNKGLLDRIKRGLYVVRFPEGGPVIPDLYIANRLYEPSYVSLETALSFYSLIPEVAAGVTSVTSRQTKLFRNKFGFFRYNSCKERAYCGYRIMLYEGVRVYIAEKEKAVVDFVYFKNRHGEKISVHEDRLDRDKLKKLSWKKMYQYGELYNKKTLTTLKKIKEQVE